MRLKTDDDSNLQASLADQINFEPVHDVLKLNPSQGIMKLIHDACKRFKLIEKGDRVAVACSGGKDSLMMIVALLALQRRADYDFELRVIHLDQHQPGFQRAQFNATLDLLGVHCEGRAPVF